MQRARLESAVQVFSRESFRENDSIWTAEIHNQSALCAVMVVMCLFPQRELWQRVQKNPPQMAITHCKQRENCWLQIKALEVLQVYMNLLVFATNLLQSDILMETHAAEVWLDVVTDEELNINKSSEVARNAKFQRLLEVVALGSNVHTCSYCGLDNNLRA